MGAFRLYPSPLLCNPQNCHTERFSLRSPSWECGRPLEDAEEKGPYSFPLSTPQTPPAQPLLGPLHLAVQPLSYMLAVAPFLLPSCPFQPCGIPAAPTCELNPMSRAQVAEALKQFRLGLRVRDSHTWGTSGEICGSTDLHSPCGRQETNEHEVAQGSSYSFLDKD